MGCGALSRARVSLYRRRCCTSTVNAESVLAETAAAEGVTAEAANHASVVDAKDLCRAVRGPADFSVEGATTGGIDGPTGTEIAGEVASVVLLGRASEETNWAAQDSAETVLAEEDQEHSEPLQCDGFSSLEPLLGLPEALTPGRRRAAWRLPDAPAEAREACSEPSRTRRDGAPSRPSFSASVPDEESAQRVSVVEAELLGALGRFSSSTKVDENICQKVAVVETEHGELRPSNAQSHFGGRTPTPFPVRRTSQPAPLFDAHDGWTSALGSQAARGAPHGRKVSSDARPRSVTPPQSFMWASRPMSSPDMDIAPKRVRRLPAAMPRSSGNAAQGCVVLGGLVAGLETARGQHAVSPRLRSDEGGLEIACSNFRCLPTMLSTDTSCNLDVCDLQVTAPRHGSLDVGLSGARRRGTTLRVAPLEASGALAFRADELGDAASEAASPQLRGHSEPQGTHDGEAGAASACATSRPTIPPLMIGNIGSRAPSPETTGVRCVAACRNRLGSVRTGQPLPRPPAVAPAVAPGTAAEAAAEARQREDLLLTGVTPLRPSRSSFAISNFALEAQTPPRVSAAAASSVATLSSSACSGAASPSTCSVAAAGVRTACPSSIRPATSAQAAGQAVCGQVAACAVTCSDLEADTGPVDFQLAATVGQTSSLSVTQAANIATPLGSCGEVTKANGYAVATQVSHAQAGTARDCALGREHDSPGRWVLGVDAQPFNSRPSARGRPRSPETQTLARPAVLPSGAEAAGALVSKPRPSLARPAALPPGASARGTPLSTPRREASPASGQAASTPMSTGPSPCALRRPERRVAYGAWRGLPRDAEGVDACSIRGARGSVRLQSAEDREPSLMSLITLT